MTDFGSVSVGALRKIQNNKKVNVVFMGGLITEGGTASEYSKCYYKIKI